MINEARFRLKKDRTPYKGCICRTPELIENYEKAIDDIKQTWICHHRLETHTSYGERRLVDIKAEELIALDMYFDRPPEDLIFLTKKEHRALHMKGNQLTKGKHHSEETRRKQSEAKKDHPVSEETKQKISSTLKDREGYWTGKKLSEEHRKHLSESHKDQIPWNKDKKCGPAWNKGKHWKLVDSKRVYD